MSTNVLFDSFSNRVPDRPSLTDDALRVKAINLAIEEIYSWEFSPFSNDDKDRLCDLMHKHFSPYIDETELAELFVSEGWPSGMLEDALNDVISEIERVHIRFSIEWENTYRPLPPFTTGDEIYIVRFNGEREYGKIMGISETEPAKFEVKMLDTPDDDQSLRLVKFECAFK
jgi:hypothetical protein